MKKILSLLSLAALTVGLLGSCSKINERIDGLEKRVDGIENDKIASVEQQIAAINQSLADLGTIRTNIQTLIEAKTAQGEDITKLKEADQALEGKIAELKAYLDTDIAKYATTDWVNATFATLEKQAEIIADITKLKQDLAGLDAELDQAIEDLDSSLKAWVNEQLSAYSTTAQMEAKIKALQDQIDALKTDNETNKSDIEELEAGLAELKQDLAAAKAAIKTAYEKAIEDALKSNDGYITEKIKTDINSVSRKISRLSGRVETLETQVEALRGDVDALKGMIQSVAIVPAYSDGSVEAEDGILTINCVITPKKAVESLTKKNFTILTSESEVLTKSALYGTLTIAKDEDLVLDKTNGTAIIKVDVSGVLPTEEDKALTVAVKIKNGISDFTTEFVPVTVAGPDIPEGALSGVFSVSATKKVRFSQGNLWYGKVGDAQTATFNFEANQYDSTPSEGGDWEASHVSHFYWSKTASVAYAASYSESGTAGTDIFFTNATAETAKSDFTVNGVTGKYRTLSTYEWQYLLNTSARMVNGKACYSNAVSGVTIGGSTYKGVFLYPDNYNGEIVSSSMTWNDINAAGIVFLPAAGYRNGSGVWNVDGCGRYWSSTAYAGNGADSVYFNNTDFYPILGDSRGYGCSVRLITESK